MQLLRDGVVERQADGQLLFRVDSAGCTGCRGCAQREAQVLMLSAATPIHGVAEGLASIAIDRRRWHVVILFLFGWPVLAAALGATFASLSGAGEVWSAPIGLVAGALAACSAGFIVRPNGPVVHLKAKPVDPVGSH